MTDILLRTGTYTPEEGDDGSEFRTKRFPDGSQIIANERGIFFIGRRAPYFVSIACVGGQASAGLEHLTKPLDILPTDERARKR